MMNKFELENLVQKLESLAGRIEQVRVNSRLPQYQQSELTEIKYSLKEESTRIRSKFNQ